MSLLGRLASTTSNAGTPTGTGARPRTLGTGHNVPLGSPTAGGLGYGLPSSRRFSVYGMEDRVVIDLGSHSLKCGYSGESHPRCVLPLYHGLRWNTRNAAPNTVWGGSTKRPTGTSSRVVISRVTAPEVFSHLLPQEADLYGLDIHQLPKEKLKDLLVYYFHQVFSEVLMTDPKLRKVLICDSPLCPVQLKATVAEVLFEHFQVPALIYFPAPGLSLVTTGSVSGLVVDCGHLETVVTPVFEGHTLIPYIQTTPLAGKALTHNLRELLLGHAILESPTSPKVSLASLLSDKVIEDIKCRFLFASPVRPSFDTRVTFPDEQAKWYQQMTTTTDLVYPVANPTSESRELASTAPAPEPLYQIRIPGWVRERAADILFNGDAEQDILGIPRTLLNCVLKTPIDLRQTLISSCLVLGNTGMLPNFTHRLHLELQHLMLQDRKYSATLKSLCNHAAFLDAKTNGDVFARGNRTWIGGSLVGSLRCQGSEISLDQFDGQVPDWTVNSEY
ncbi:hypothetical protein IWQ62_001565 [Dispira parvispora]|uniref:Uncharacterized protein n=1 Tax=Dispira parvispora TaxID=1520584 RepID=A0A9W8AY27_9FUNG|nr:hypothetical protein IWQ62_001565 [Dispira parvispora]